MIKGLPFVLAFTALPTFAAPQLLTEITAGDVWVKGSFTQHDVDRDLTNKSNGLEASQSDSIDSVGVTGLAAFDANLSVMPVVGFNVDSQKDDGEKAKEFTGLVGFINKSSSDKNIGLFMSYEHSDNTDENRGAFDIDARFQTTSPTYQHYNEVAVSYSISKDEGGLKGGDVFLIQNRFKFQFNPMIDFLATAGIMNISNIEDTDLNAKVDYDPFLVLGGELFINIDPKFSASFAIGKSYGNGTQRSDFNSDIDIDIDSTIVSIDFTGRF